MSDTAPEVTARHALRLASGGAQVLDVREPHEWRAGHAPQARHLPLGHLALEATPWHGRPVVVLCRSGSRAASATGLLRRHGVEAFAVSGGMGAWRDAGGPVVADDGRPGAIV